LYAKPGQTEIADIWANKPPEDSRFYKFMDNIAKKVQIDENWRAYRGEMGTIGNDSKTPAYYKLWNNVEIVFHVAPWMDEEQRRRLCGNDVGAFSLLHSPRPLPLAFLTRFN